MRESIIFILLFLVFVAGGFGLAFTTFNSPRIYDQLAAASNLTLRVVGIIENTYLFLYGAAVVELAFVLLGSSGIIPAWSKIVDSCWIVMVAYGLLFLIGAALATMATASAYRGAVSPITGYTPSATQLREVMDKLFTTTQAGIDLWIVTAVLFILLPLIRHAIRTGPAHYT